jgi:hypothetical protein
MYKVVKLAKSQEEKVANKITVLLSDLTLDLEAIGLYLARTAPHIIYRRALEVLEAMEYNKEVQELDRGAYREQL